MEVLGFCDNDVTKKGTCIQPDAVCFGNVEDCTKVMDADTVFVIGAKGRYGAEMTEELLNKRMVFIDGENIDFPCTGEDYYDEAYFAWQKKCGSFSAKLDIDLFAPHINPEDSVLEFGSAGGYLLERIVAKEKLGVEINDVARAEAERRGIYSVKTIDEVPDNFADVIISKHVLEHIENPLAVLRTLRNKLKDGGTIIFVVPYECNDTDYNRDDINQHLYTWNSICLGNLFKRAGYFVKKVDSYSEQWPYPNYEAIYDAVGKDGFKVISGLFGEKVNMKNTFILAIK